MSIILGLNTSHPGSSAAIIKDGKPIFAIAEERLNRVKYYSGFPKLAIQECLKFAGISISDIEYVAIGKDPSANKAEKVKYTLKNVTKIPKILKVKNRNELDDLKTLFSKELECNLQALTFKQINVEHHVAHISSAYYLSGWDNAAGISIDGSGDFVTCMMANCVGENIEVKKKIFTPNSLGDLYLMICQFIGYDRYGDEGKVMGLAPLGTNSYKSFFDDLLIFEEDSFRLNLKYFRPLGDHGGFTIDSNGQAVLPQLYSDKVVSLMGSPRKRNAEITQRDMDLAFGLQYLFEIAYMHLLNALYKKVPNDRVVMAGGCALNSVANGKLFGNTPFKESFIQPAAGDDGLALGAALYVSNAILKESSRHSMLNSYLGNSYTNDEIEIELKKANIKYHKLSDEDLVEKVSDQLVNGKVIGWFQGRMEWGPRALGNRSIIAHPGYPDMKNILNARIKHREEFRPFAPAVLEEFQNEIFEHDHPSPFMLHVYKIKEQWRDRLSAVNHVDNTGRLQTVNSEENKLYYDLIKKFHSKSGVPVIINTSFNENEPIVCTPQQAIDCYARTKMDCIAIGNFYAHKEDSV